jgi:hypothetical protein
MENKPQALTGNTRDIRPSNFQRNYDTTRVKKETEWNGQAVSKLGL